VILVSPIRFVRTHPQSLVHYIAWDPSFDRGRCGDSTQPGQPCPTPAGWWVARFIRRWPGSSMYILMVNGLINSVKVCLVTKVVFPTSFLSTQRYSPICSWRKVSQNDPCFPWERPCLGPGWTGGDGVACTIGPLLRSEFFFYCYYSYCYYYY